MFADQGAQAFKGIAKLDMFERMAAFIFHMHSRNIIHRDLSSGNLMMTLDGDKLEFYAIDIGRAVIDSNKRRHRYLDLKRICYKLDWADRELFIEAYNQQGGRALSIWWRVSLFSYDFKQTAKKMLKGKYRRKKRPL